MPSGQIVLYGGRTRNHSTRQNATRAFPIVHLENACSAAIRYLLPSIRIPFWFESLTIFYWQFAAIMASFFNNKARAEEAKQASSSKKPVVEAAPRSQPWVEKYRPRDLSLVRGQDHTVNILRRMVNASNLPHLLLYGPPGTGKTSTILALSRELFGPELFSNRVLELNASDERGLSVVRERVKNFAQQALIHAPSSKEYRERYP